MKFAALAITVMSFLVSHSASANPADIQCNVLNSGGTALDLSVDPNTGELLGLSVYKITPVVAAGQPTPPSSPEVDFPVDQIKNFFVDLSSLKVHGVDPDTEAQTISIDYSRNLRLGRISMTLGTINLVDQILVCKFD